MVVLMVWLRSIVLSLLCLTQSEICQSRLILQHRLKTKIFKKKLYSWCVMVSTWEVYYFTGHAKWCLSARFLFFTNHHFETLMRLHHLCQSRSIHEPSSYVQTCVRTAKRAISHSLLPSVFAPDQLPPSLLASLQTYLILILIRSIWARSPVKYKYTPTHKQSCIQGPNVAWQKEEDLRMILLGKCLSVQSGFYMTGKYENKSSIFQWSSVIKLL